LSISAAIFLALKRAIVAGSKIGEGGPEGVALAQDRDPGKAGLEPVEDQVLKQRATIELRHAPFLVVVRDIERVCASPGGSVSGRRDEGRKGCRRTSIEPSAR
jgi:hypothetical protein